jgi:cobalt-zinc-cadmium efflux system outer membrane protein
MRARSRYQTSATLLIRTLGSLAVVTALAFAGAARADEADLDPADERGLATAARLATILRVVDARNADVAEAVLRASAAEARVRGAGRLPDPELKGELWGVPLARPLSFRQSDTIMLGLRQALPPWGTLDARERAAREDAATASDAIEARRQEVAAQARRAFATYARADREVRIHLEHAGLTSRLAELARAQYAVGRGSQQDLLDAQVELSRLHLDVASVEQQRGSAAALLNALMNRAPDAPLGPVPDGEAGEALADAEETPRDADATLDARRPELRAATRAVQRSEATLDLAKREASLPSLMVGADYWYMPMAETHHGYGAMVTMSLPWLNLRRRDDVTAAERTTKAERRALEAQRTTARYQLRDADAKLRAAREVLTLLHERVLADARRGYEAAEAQYRAGRGGVAPVLAAARSYLQVRVDEVRAIAELESSRADYARAAGLPNAGLARAHLGDAAGSP